MTGLNDSKWWNKTRQMMLSASLWWEGCEVFFFVPFVFAESDISLEEKRMYCLRTFFCFVSLMYVAQLNSDALFPVFLVSMNMSQCWTWTWHVVMKLIENKRQIRRNFLCSQSTRHWSACGRPLPPCRRPGHSALPPQSCLCWQEGRWFGQIGR